MRRALLLLSGAAVLAALGPTAPAAAASATGWTQLAGTAGQSYAEPVEDTVTPQTAAGVGLRWSTTEGTSALAVATPALVVTIGGRALSARTGALRWQAPGADTGYVRVLGMSGQVVIADDCRAGPCSLIGLSARDGSQLWSNDALPELDQGITQQVFGRRAMVAQYYNLPADDGSFVTVSVRAADGAVLWTRTNLPGGPLALREDDSGRSLYVLAPDRADPTMTDLLEVALSSGIRQRTFADVMATYHQTPQLMVSGGTAVIRSASSRASICAIDLADGARRWCAGAASRLDSVTGQVVLTAREGDGSYIARDIGTGRER